MAAAVVTEEVDPMECLVLLATEEALMVVDPAGEIVQAELPGHETISVAAGDGWVYAATRDGVFRRRESTPDDWEAIGLADERVWVVAAGKDGTAFAGVEPASLWRLGGDGPVELEGLRVVEGHEEWHSPWGPADLSTVAVDGARLVVGIEQGGVAVSNDAGATWEARTDGLYDDVHHVATDGLALYATTGMGFFRSDDEGKSWRWESEGLDRGYTQGLTKSGSTLFVSGASGPPPMWERDGPEAAVFRASVDDRPLSWTVAFDGVAGNIERQALATANGLVIAGTTAGELVVGDARGTDFPVVRDDLPAIVGVAVIDAR